MKVHHLIAVISVFLGLAIILGGMARKGIMFHPLPAQHAVERHGNCVRSPPFLKFCEEDKCVQTYEIGLLHA